MPKIIGYPALFLFLITLHPAIAEEERLTLGWIFSDDRRLATAAPKHVWLDTGDIVLYDITKKQSERTLELLDPGSGQRAPLIDPHKAIDNISSILKPKESIEELGWPEAFSPDGRLALYQSSGHIFLLDLQTAAVTIITGTDHDESSPLLSPDGKWISFIRNNDIYAWNIERKEEIRLTTSGTDTLLNGTVSWVYWEELLNRADRGYVWSPDSTAIAYLQTDEADVGTMHYVDFEPNLPRLIKQRHPKPGETNPSVRAGVVGLDSRVTVWIDFDDHSYEYLPRIKWLPDSDQLAIQTMNRSQTVVDLFLANRKTGQASHLLRETNEGWINIHDDLYFLANSETFLWRSERSGYAHLYRFDMEGNLINQVTSGNWALQSSGGAAGMDQAISYVNEQASRIYFTGLKKSSTQRHLYRVDLNGKDLEQISVLDGSHAVYFSPNGDYYIDSHSAIDRPPTLVVQKIGSEQKQFIKAPSNKISESFKLLEWELFTIAARDGFAMPAAMLKPLHFDPNKKYPVVTYVYGGPSAPSVVNSWAGGSRGYFHQLLANQGAIIFKVDNRSAAGKSKIDANTILNQLYGPVELNDLMDGITWLKQQEYVDPEQLGIWGWSGGGTMTLQSMTSTSEFTAGISVAPVTDWHYYDTIYTERYMKQPEENKSGYERTSHVNRAHNLKGRLLLVHGTYDDNVHPQNSWAFSDRLIEAGITFDMMIYPMRKHGISDDAAQLHIYKTMYEFWEKQLSIGD